MRDRRPCIDNKQQRIREIAELQSLLAIQEQRFRHPDLKFSSPPRTPIDPPSDLDIHDAYTARFVDYRTKLLPDLHARATALLPIGDYDADRRRERLIADIEQFMCQAVAAEHRVWRDKMLARRMGVDPNGPEIVSTGELVVYDVLSAVLIS